MNSDGKVASSVKQKESGGHRKERNVGDSKQPQGHGVSDGLGQGKSGWKQAAVHEYPMVSSLWKSDAVLRPIAALELRIDVFYTLEEQLQAGWKGENEAVALE